MYSDMESLPFFIVARAMQVLTLRARVSDMYMPSMILHAEAEVVQIATCPMISLDRDNNRYANTSWSMAYHSSYTGLETISSLSLIF
jgi:hypothetical protein